MNTADFELLPTCINDIINDYAKDLTLIDLEESLRIEFRKYYDWNTPAIKRKHPQAIEIYKERYNRITNLPIDQLLKKQILNPFFNKEMNHYKIIQSKYIRVRGY